MPEIETVPLTPQYFIDKLTQPRKKIKEIDRLASEAIGIAYTVLRLCYPLRVVRKTLLYYNNAPRASLWKTASVDPDRKEHVVIDVHCVIGEGGWPSDEAGDFIIEVALPQGSSLRSVDYMARVRWADLGWYDRRGTGDILAPHTMCSETYVNFWR